MIYKIAYQMAFLGLIICLANFNFAGNWESSKSLNLKTSPKILGSLEDMRLDSALKYMTLELGSKKHSREELLKFKNHFSYFSNVNKSSLLLDFKVEYDNHYKENCIKVYFKNGSYTINYLGEISKLEVFRINDYGLLIYDEMIKKWMLFCSDQDAMFTIIGYVHCVYVLNGDLTVNSAFKFANCRPGIVMEKYSPIKPTDKYLGVTKCYITNLRFIHFTFGSFKKLISTSSELKDCEKFKSIIAPYFIECPLWTDRSLIREIKL
jgi:hypothetical protein